MPRKKVQVNDPSQVSPEAMKKSRPKLQFIEIPLTAKDEEELMAGWSPDMPLIDVIDWFVDRGYRVSFGNDSYHSSAMCSVQGKEPTNPNYNLMMSGRGASVKSAYLSMCYKFFVKREGGAWIEDHLDEPEKPKREFF